MDALTLAPLLVAKSYDTDKNGKVDDNLKISAKLKNKIDTDKNGSVDVIELSKSIENDKVIVKDGSIFARKGDLKITSNPEFSKIHEAVNSELYKIQEPLSQFNNVESEYPKLQNTANCLLNNSKVNADKYSKETTKAIYEIKNYIENEPNLDEAKASDYLMYLKTTRQLAKEYASLSNFLDYRVNALNDAISLNPSSTVLDIARKSYELSVSLTEKSSKGATVGKISEAKVITSKLELEKMLPQLQNLNEKITKANPAFEEVKYYIM